VPPLTHSMTSRFRPPRPRDGSTIESTAAGPRRAGAVLVRDAASVPGWQRARGTIAHQAELCGGAVLPMPLLCLSACFEATRVDYYRGFTDVRERGDRPGCVCHPGAEAKNSSCPPAARPLSSSALSTAPDSIHLTPWPVLRHRTRHPVGLPRSQKSQEDSGRTPFLKPVRFHL
jgi:hypothetical protein